MDLNDDNDIIKDSNFNPNSTQKKKFNFIDYLSEILLGDNDQNDTELFDDVENNGNYEKSFNDLITLSKMNFKDVLKHTEIDDLEFNEKTNSYNKKYSNIIEIPVQYQTDFELKINDDENINFLQSKK